MKLRAIFCVFVLIFCSTLVFAMGGKKDFDEEGREIVTITCTVKVYGNEPHTWLGLVAKDGTEYAISADDETIASLRQKQGLLLTVKGGLEPPSKDGTSLGFNTLPGGRIYIESVKQD